jgi:serine/threonine kinase 38
MENHMVKEEIVEVIDGEQEEEENVVGGDGEDDVVSTLTMERVEAAKKFIENHYRSQMKHIQERKEK